MKRRLLFLTLVVLVGAGAAAINARRAVPAPELTTDVVSRGAVVSVVSTSGTVEAVTTVQVGTQVSGTVRALSADFNALVRKGQVLARLDPSLFEAEVLQARANLVRAEADVERLRVAVSDAGAKLTRARQLAERQLIPASELETAEVTLRSAQAQQRSAEAQVTQARATLSQAEVNLEKTIITSPIDGIVIARNVDVGQTVAASLQAPTLFEIAADMRRMQIKASVDEADVGQVRQGQPVGFTVDAYPGRQFSGTVQQVRLNPVVEQNVVTYAAIISADNPDLMLRPGMTANVTVEIARRDDVLRVPAAALRFRPSADVLSRLGAGTAVASSGASVPAVGGTAGAGGPAGTQGEAVWVFDSALRRVPVKTGVSDGVLTELVEAPDLAAGTIVVTRAAIAGDAPRSPGTTAGNPLLGSTPPRR